VVAEPGAATWPKRRKKQDAIGRSCFEQGPQIIDELSSERVADHGHADRAHDRPQRCNFEL
jgi:hypothetical protein